MVKGVSYRTIAALHALFLAIRVERNVNTRPAVIKFITRNVEKKKFFKKKKIELPGAAAPTNLVLLIERTIDSTFGHFITPLYH